MMGFSRIGLRGNEFRIFVRKILGKHSLERPRRGSKGDIKIGLTEGLLAISVTPTLENHFFSVVRDCLLSVLTAVFLIVVSSPSSVTQTQVTEFSNRMEWLGHSSDGVWGCGVCDLICPFCMFTLKHNHFL
jgi:hypothetical protein